LSQVAVAAEASELVGVLSLIIPLGQHHHQAIEAFTAATIVLGLGFVVIATEQTHDKSGGSSDGSSVGTEGRSHGSSFFCITYNSLSV